MYLNVYLGAIDLEIKNGSNTLSQTLDTPNLDSGWITVGTYRLTEPTVDVLVSDKAENSYKKYVFADAIRWTPVEASEWMLNVAGNQEKQMFPSHLVDGRLVHVWRQLSFQSIVAVVQQSQISHEISSLSAKHGFVHTHNKYLTYEGSIGKTAINDVV